MIRALVMATCVAATSGWAQELSLEKVAQAEHARTKALDKVDKTFGNKKSSEMTREERKAHTSARADAEKTALEASGVSAKQLERHQAKMSRDDQKALKGRVEALKKADDAKTKEEAAAKEGAQSSDERTEADLDQ